MNDVLFRENMVQDDVRLEPGEEIKLGFVRRQVYHNVFLFVSCTTLSHAFLKICHMYCTGLPIFSLSRGYLHPSLNILGGIFTHPPLFINLEGITACSKLLNFHET